MARARVVKGFRIIFYAFRLKDIEVYSDLKFNRYRASILSGGTETILFHCGDRAFVIVGSRRLNDVNSRRNARGRDRQADHDNTRLGLSKEYALEFRLHAVDHHRWQNASADFQGFGSICDWSCGRCRRRPGKGCRQYEQKQRGRYKKFTWHRSCSEFTVSGPNR